MSRQACKQDEREQPGRLASGRRLMSRQQMWPHSEGCRRAAAFLWGEAHLCSDLCRGGFRGALGQGGLGPSQAAAAQEPAEPFRLLPGGPPEREGEGSRGLLCPCLCEAEHASKMSRPGWDISQLLLSPLVSRHKLSVFSRPQTLCTWCDLDTPL